MKTDSSSFASRRRFLKQSAAAALAFLPANGRAAHALSKAPSTPIAAPSDAAIRNRAPLAPNAFYTLPLGAVRPTGWLRSQLQIQASGLGGHLDET
ncbi:MAG: twin-arginine translocation signal domain-containing protein, partial [Edaphobacter sp.]